MAIKNDRLIRALLRQPVDRTPIWFMRQAGRYLEEYRELRQQAGDFLTLMRTPDLATEATMMPLRRYDLDAAILFSDILTIPDAMGLELYFSAGEGPKFAKPLLSASDISALTPPDIGKQLRYVTDAVRQIKQQLNNERPLIGFSGSPWTLATYMVGEHRDKDFKTIKSLIYDEPQAAQQLLQCLSDSITDYLNAQIEAGVDVVMIFDTWGGVLSDDAYRRFSLDYMQRIIAGLERQRDGQPIPVILFTKGSAAWLEWMADSGCDAVGLDWTVDIAQAKQRIGDRVALQGNMDPAMLRASPERIQEEVTRILTAFGGGTGHVFNLGHGITPDIDPAHVQAMVQAVTTASL